MAINYDKLWNLVKNKMKRVTSPKQQKSVDTQWRSWEKMNPCRWRS